MTDNGDFIQEVLHFWGEANETARYFMVETDRYWKVDSNPAVIMFLTTGFSAKTGETIFKVREVEQLVDGINTDESFLEMFGKFDELLSLFGDTIWYTGSLVGSLNKYYAHVLMHVDSDVEHTLATAVSYTNNMSLLDRLKFEAHNFCTDAATMQFKNTTYMQAAAAKLWLKRNDPSTLTGNNMEIGRHGALDLVSPNEFNTAVWELCKGAYIIMSDFTFICEVYLRILQNYVKDRDEEDPLMKKIRIHGSVASAAMSVGLKSVVPHTQMRLIHKHLS